MRVAQVRPADPIGDFVEKNKDLFWSFDTIVGSKITSLVLDCLGSVRLKSVSALFPAMYTAQVMTDAVLSLKRRSCRKQKPRVEKEGGARFVQKDRTRYQLGAPIGLHRSHSDWINAWVQFILYLPKFSEVISLAEKSFAPFVEFVEQYLWDQKEGKALSLVDSALLFRCLSKHHIQMQADHFYKMCKEFFVSIFPGIADGLGAFLYDSIVFHPEWVLEGVTEASSLFQQGKKRPTELIIAREKQRGEGSCLMKRQLCLGQGKYLYDLDSLIELRIDGARSCFVTYVRVDGAWYQCEDETIRWISSRTLSVPLSRGVLFHYKQVVL